ncbi:Gfo/Idh/MocA family oxidoreductase [Bacillaceae bacterium Marseille-Q3522]|nr:Gfo/Idh/MocA family oxidoreductase [Bacillaceae bacterium Marseille-Q3522]
MKKLNWAIIGPGAIANEFAKALGKEKENLIAVGARNLEKATKFAEQFNIPKVYDDFDALLADDEIDVVYISTPHTFHYEFMIKSLQHGKHILCEKAITVNGTQLNEIMSLAEEKHLAVAEAMTIYHMPLFKKLHDLFDSGKLGKLKMIQVSFGSCKEDNPNNRFFNPDLAGGALLDIGVYALSLVRYFLSSQPNEILTTVKKYQTGVDEQSGIILKNSDDEMAVVALTMRAKMKKQAIIAGDAGYIVVEDFPRATKAVITYTEGVRVETVEYGKTELALHYEIQAMNDYILNQTDNRTLGLSSDVQAIMDEVRKQWGIRYSFE